MKDFKTNWSREELKAYLLLYCAHADIIETEEEKQLIISRVGNEKYQSIHEEFEQDNDYQSIQKIKSTMDRYNYSEEEVDELFYEIKELFLSDGSYETMERNIEMALKHILK
jgi:hypothetical protein